MAGPTDTRSRRGHSGLLELMLATGLRVGDAVGFDPRALTEGVSLWIYTYQPQKQKRADKPKVLEAYITDEMKKRIDECTWLSTRGPFWYGTGLNPTPVAQAVYERMQGIGNRTSTLALNHVKQIQGIASTARGLSEITVDVALIGARVTAQPARRPALVPAQDAEARGGVRATFQGDLRCGIPRASAATFIPALPGLQICRRIVRTHGGNRFHHRRELILGAHDGNHRRV